MKKENSELFSFELYFYLIVLSVIYELFVYFFGIGIDNYIIILVPLSIAYILMSFIILRKRGMPKDYIFGLLFNLAIILRTIYILKTNIYTRQHDVLKLSDPGHLGYIYTLFSTHHLPISNEWQFYHPPLWHILGAIWLWVNSILKIDLLVSLEGIQILSLFCSALIIVIADRICLKLKITDKSRCFALGLLVINPTLILLSGSINNDCLLLFLECLIILYLFNWYEDTSIKNTIKLAIVTGLCVMTKMNGAIMAVPILYVFIKKVVEVTKNKKEKLKKYFDKIMLFGIISLPIGLWFQARSLIKFGFSRVPEPNDWLYTGNHSLFSRFFTLDFDSLLNYANMDSNYNLPSFLIRSAIFGEYRFDIPRWLFILLIGMFGLLILIFLLFSIKYIFSKKKNIYINTLLIAWCVCILSSYIFYYKYPYACSMDYRYVSFCLFSSSVVIGYMLSIHKNNKLKIFTYIVCLIYAVSNILFLLNI